jgi:hypothetical protein
VLVDHHEIDVEADARVEGFVGLKKSRAKVLGSGN